MSRILCLGLNVVLLAATPAAAQITVSAPANGTNTVAAANDFATTVLQDPWDMSQNTDGGWFVHSVDFPQAGWSSAGFSNGLFGGVVAAQATLPNLWLLETGFAGAAPVGRFGLNYPIDANRYRIASIRLCVSQANGAMIFGWTANTIFDPPGLQVLEQRLYERRMSLLHRRSADARDEWFRAVGRDQAFLDTRARRRPDRWQQRQH